VRLFPAIDILGAHAVRLVRGDFQASKLYDADPAVAAAGWIAAGAQRLHVVDLDGAREGAPQNLEHLRYIAELGVPVQFGGGLRSEEAIEQALEAGAERVILGTAALIDPPLLDRALAIHGPERIAVSVDARAGMVATHGWLQSTDLPVTEALAALIDTGVRTFVYTDIDHDGMLDGTSHTGIAAIARAVGGARLIVSGGIGSLADLLSLAALRAEQDLQALEGVIVGTALYEGRFTVADAQRALQD
jgi:phosphoribosylformimino-5-aminoimidazole carboxamide ribotide isomerase